MCNIIFLLRYICLTRLLLHHSVTNTCCVFVIFGCVFVIFEGRLKENEDILTNVTEIFYVA